MLNRTYRGCVYRATLLVGNRRKKRCYIGKALSGLSRRRSQHYAQAKLGLSTPFAAALLAYSKAAFQWEELFASDDDDLLKAVEIEQIATHKQQGWHLYNLSAGGDGCNGVKWTPEERARRMATNADRRARGLTKRTPEHRAKLSAAKLGKPGPHIGDEARAKIAEAKRAYWAKWRAEGGVVSEEARKKNSAAQRARYAALREKNSVPSLT